MIFCGFRQLLQCDTKLPAFEKEKKGLSDATDVAGMHTKCLVISVIYIFFLLSGFGIYGRGAIYLNELNASFKRFVQTG